MSKLCKAVFLTSLVAACTSYAANNWSVNNNFDSTGWSSTQNNFLLKQVPTLSDDFTKYTEAQNKDCDASMLTDGKMTTAASDYSNTFGISSGTATWTFAEPIKEFRQLIVYTHWGNSGRDGIAISAVEVTTDGTNWTPLQMGNASVVNGAGGWEGAGRRRFLLTGENDEPMATNIVGLRIVFPASQENGGIGCTEIEAIGTAKDVPMLNASVTYVAPRKAGISVSVLGCGAGYSDVEIYFAYGTSEDALGAYQRVGEKTAYAKGETCAFDVRDLSKDTLYYYSCYVENGGDERSDMVAGTFRTTDGSVLTWLGAVSGDWSDDDNWDSEEAPAPGSSLAKIVLSATGNNYAPTNLDIEGLEIDELCFGADCRSAFAMSGAPLKVGKISTLSGSTGTYDIGNEVTFAAEIVTDVIGAKLRLAGPVHATPSDAIVYSSSDWRNDVALMNPANDFAGTFNITAGTFNFYSNGALGQAPSAAPASPNIVNNVGNGNVVAAADDGNRLNSIVMDPNWWFAGKMTINGGVELAYNGPIGDGTWFTSPQWSTWRYLTLGGSSLASAQPMFSTNAMIVIDRVYLATIGSQSVVNEPTRGLLAGTDASVDLNGCDPVGPLATDGAGRQGAPNFVNGNSADESVVSGAVRLGGLNSDGSDSVLFGGLGDIRLEGDVYENADLDNPAARPFRKQGPGKLTIASDSTSWRGDTVFVGDVTLDYSTHGTRKLGGNSSAKMGDGTLSVVGNASGTTCELEELALHYGLTKLATSGDVSWTLSSLTMPSQSIGNLQVAPAVDFAVGSGFRFDDAAYENLAGFGGLGPNFTVNGGADWAALNDGAIEAMPTALVQNLGAGENVLSGSGAIRAAAADDMTIAIDGALTLSAYGAENAAGILYSSAAGGDLTIGGGVLAAADGASSLTIQNWNTDHVLTINSRIAKPDGGAASFDLTLIGPGTTVLANDENTFSGGPNVFGGGTVKFTSAKCFSGGNGATGYSALGRAGVWNGDLYCGDGATYEYIGTDPAGIVCDRNFNASGEVTFKANGVGPFVIKHPGPVNPLIKSCRIVLAGDADKGGGVLSNENGWGYGAKLNPGDCGEVIKRGTGKWAVGSSDGVYGLRTVVEAGELELMEGALIKAPVFVKSGATLQLDSGSKVCRDLTVEAGATLAVVYDGETPAVVWGRVKLAGALSLPGQRLREEAVVLTAESGFDGTIAAPEGYKLIVDGSSLTLRPCRGLGLIIR